MTGGRKISWKVVSKSNGILPSFYFRESQNAPQTVDSVPPTTAENEATAESSTDERRSSIDFSSLMDQMDVDKFTGDIPGKAFSLTALPILNLQIYCNENFGYLGEESCYKKVRTVDGPKVVLSVSQTFIKLKDLIVEKKHLQREIETLKQLHSKLESKVRSFAFKSQSYACIF